MLSTNLRLLPVLALLAAAGPALPARADLMAACAPDIARYCTDIDKGRGRISACLASEMGRLGTACRPEVQAVMQGPLTPRYVRRALDPAFQAPLPEVCVAPAASVCPDVPRGDGRVFACLYARAERAGKVCSDAAQSTLRQTN